jgi:hypothetical protein
VFGVSSSVYAILVDHDRLMVAAYALQALDIGQSGRCRHRVQEHVHAAHEVEIVIDLLHGVLVGQAVEELQRAESRLDGVRRGDVRRDLLLWLLLFQLLQSLLHHHLLLLLG